MTVGDPSPVLPFLQLHRQQHRRQRARQLSGHRSHR